MGNAVTNPGRFIEKKAFGVTNREDSIFVNKDARCRFAHNVVAHMAAKIQSLRKTLCQHLMLSTL